jgi:hypothetical protein
MFLQGVGMVYFHFPFSTHAPPFEEAQADVLELNLQELGTSLQRRMLWIREKFMCKVLLTFIPSYLISYITNKGEKK